MIVVNSKSLEISDDNLVNICNFLEAAPGFSSMLTLSYEALDPHKTDIAIIWDINDECS